MWHDVVVPAAEAGQLQVSASEVSAKRESEENSRLAAPAATYTGNPSGCAHAWPERAAPVDAGV